MSGDPKALAQTYFRAWEARDWPALRAVLADGVTFTGPMGTATGIDECMGGLQGVAKRMTGIDIKAMVVDAQDVITWYELRTGAVTSPTANWSHVENGKITAIRAAFDPRAMLAA